MEMRALGQGGLRVSVLGFGCGNVGGLMIRGTPAERERAVARALELGVTYFDTAPSYGDGQSEANLGRALAALGARVAVGTKVRLDAADLADIRGAVARSLDASLRRLGLDHVDLLHLHNPIAAARGDGTVSTADVLDAAVPALQALRTQGKIGGYGITAIGDTEALHRVVGAGALDSAQVFLNLLNPSAARPVPAGFPAQDFRGLLGLARRHGTGAIVVRVAAAGALTGTTDRHAIAAPAVAPIASGPDYAADVRRARALAALVEEGHTASLVEASLRFALGAEGVSTILVGYSSLDHLEAAAAAINRGPLPPAALVRLEASWETVAGR